MAYASQAGRARVSPSNPQAQAVCDRCGIWYNRVNLSWQYEWRGSTLKNIRLLVCPSCLDVPQENVRAIVIPADPVPIIQPRTEDYAQDEINYHTITAPPTIDPETGIPIPGTTRLLSEDGEALIEQDAGRPLGLDQGAVMPIEGVAHYRVQLNPTSVSSLGSDVITATFPSPHGLATDDQIVVQGLSNPDACGAFSITVSTATVFTYQANTAIPASALLTPSTLMVTAHIGLPLGATQLPLTGGLR